MEQSIEDYAKCFLESSSNILLLYGPPGTGKSTFIRTLLFAMKLPAQVCYSEHLMEHPSFVPRAALDEHALVLEDCDNILRHRTQGNTALPAFLNATSGIVTSSKSAKIVFSTNLPNLESIDPAITRPGRCFDVLHFRELDRDEASKVCAEMGSADHDLNLKRHWTLAELLAKNPREKAERKQSVGFF